ncbi:AfsA-related hotdog domain-containing protein [Streptomyces sp. NPDC057302]|uniref:AfsA-related hotdog domain-containing protein n=1 Tax=Streptomyces sp. NPDC057302 TaxID=3346094 RepID=UPI00363B78EF
MASLLVVSLKRQGSSAFTARCQWPRLHPLNERAIAVSHHPLIMAESTRQLAVALARQPHGLGSLEPVSVSLGFAPGPRPTERGSATDVAVRVSVSDHATQAGLQTAYRITAEYEHAGKLFGSCTMRCARPANPDGPPAAARSSPSLLHPPAAAVGAAADTDVMLARAPQGRLFIAPRDPGHPVLLAGRPARLPALAVLEAARQAALLTSGMTAAAVAGLHMELRAPVPLSGALVEVTAEPGGSRVLIMAAGQIAALGTVALPGA